MWMVLHGYSDAFSVEDIQYNRIKLVSFFCWAGTIYDICHGKYYISIYRSRKVQIFGKPYDAWNRLCERVTNLVKELH